MNNDGVDNVIFASVQFPDSCSCGIDYESINQTYKEHLIKEHLVKKVAD